MVVWRLVDSVVYAGNVRINLKCLLLGVLVDVFAPHGQVFKNPSSAEDVS